MTDIYDRLHHACAALGTRLFTVTILDAGHESCWRAFTSHPAEYPVSGTKPIARDGWYDHCIRARQSFVANTTPEFARYFFDHALITSLGLGSCVNIPVVAPDSGSGAGPDHGPAAVIATINLLAEEQHFTPERLAAYEAIAAAHAPALLAAIRSGQNTGQKTGQT